MSVDQHKVQQGATDGWAEGPDDDGDDALVAIIGMAGRFPGAPDLEQFWRNLAAGVESMRHFTDEELLAAGESAAALRDPGYVRVCPVLDDIDKFDAGFFGFSPKEAAISDPQHRLFLEIAWEAFESAGYDPGRAPGVVGVWAACGLNAYLMHHLVTNPDLMESVGEWLLRHTANDMNFLATRVSYELDLRGPSMNVQTACSSTLVTLHLAVQSLLGRECDLALAGGSTISLPQRGYIYKEGEILSADGHCRPFDARSKGTLFGSGAGAIVLKRLADARRDRDNVLALVRGSAINNDGSQKVGYLAPSVEGQARAIAEALSVSGVDAGTISYVEAHGTGTLIGDPIEVSALTQAFRAHTDRRGFCGLGSLKSNIGHLGEAAGVGGIIKTVLALGHGQIPPSAGYQIPNPNIDFAASPFYVSDRLRDWPRGAGPRRAGITALGAGGTNAHVVLEEAPAAPPSGPAREWQVLPLSARSAAALEAATQRLAAHLRATPTLPLVDAAFTLQVGRRAFEHRRVAVCRDGPDAIAVLEGADPRRLLTQAKTRKGVEVVFSFPGAGAQHAGMGQELYETEPLYRAAVDECLEHVRPELGIDLRPLLYPSREPGAREAADARLESPSLALPALFATEYALVQLLRSWGIAPTAMIGHSLGEYVAACVAGVFSSRDGMRLVAKRGLLIETLPPGGMLVVPLPAEELAPLLRELGLSIAAVNTPELCVASGPVDAIAALEAKLVAREIDARRLHIIMPAHSSMLDPILPEFERFCRTIAFSAPTLPYLSNLSGRWIAEREASDPQYWVRHLRQSVRFADGLATLIGQKDSCVLLEVGPGRTLTSLATMQPTKPAGALPTMIHPKETGSGVAFLLGTLGQLWLAGAELDWERGHGTAARPRRVPLPTYPFERQRYWIERGQATAARATAPGALKKVPDLADWFWLPSWTRTASLPAAAAPGATTLLFVEESAGDGGGDESGLGVALAARLPGAVTVRAGAGFARTPDGAFTVAPGLRADYEQLLAALRADGKLPDEVVHLWSVAGPRRAAGDALAGYERAFELGFASLLCLAQALALEDRPARLTIVSSRLHRIGAETEREPLKALLLGPARVIGAELPAIASRSVDVSWPVEAPWQRRRVVEQVLAELGAPRPANPPREEKVIAYRGAERLVQSFERAPLPARAEGARGFREGGVYLVTGGLGGIGATLAEHLARTARAKLVLVGRSARPERERALTDLGADLLVVQADVTDLAQMRAAMSAARARFGPVTGIIHAAGVLEDELILLKTVESAARVMAPKVKGALVLDALARESDVPPELFLLFSSVSAVLGLQGQVDYTAANAFLDALALERAGRTPETSLAIDWGAWRDVGMAATMAARGQTRTGTAPMASGDWLGTRRADGAFERALGVDDWWLLSEHVVKGGDALIPGTGFLELAREAATRALPGAGALELDDVVFLAPFALAGGQRRHLRVGVSADGELAIDSVAADGASGEVRHVAGRAARVAAAAPALVDVAALRVRCAEARPVGAGGFLPQRFMSFGPRWGNIAAIGVGGGEALIDLELPASFAGDLTTHLLHPALLDMATGAAQALIPGFDAERDFHVPFSYGRVRLHAALPRRLSSHVRYRKDSAKDLPAFDVVLFGEGGRVLVEIAGFVMKRVSDRGALAGAAAGAAAERAAPAGGAEAMATELREAAFREGMLPAEGLEALERIVAARLGPEVVASSLDLNEWLAATARANHPTATAPSDAAASAAAPAARPSVSTTFEAPRGEEEERVAGLWRSMLGVEQVGVHDNFFELGGHSLLLTQTITRLRKLAGVDIPLGALLSKLTIAEMAAEVARVKAAGKSAAPPPMRAVSRDAYRAKRSAVGDGKPGRSAPDESKDE
ncbi:MAG TPA: SDR family NAD(P)-dependent oxidoreductase [Polyangia bacterium]|nr:SDR family NAD(P)-dependent oxidoreductase [Polyangia bacterium]